MPMPHRVQMQLIRRRLTGKDGADRVRELRAVLSDLPDYRNGPYADLRKWVQQEIEATRVRSRTVHRDGIGVRREGVAQVALVGAPNAGKSSLLHAMSHVQVKIGDYAFTTLRPVPALTRIHGVLVQLVEIPGLIPGAAEGRGGGRALLSVLRGADAVLYCHDAAAPAGGLGEVMAEVRGAGIELPAALVATKADELGTGVPPPLRALAPALPAAAVSILDDASVDALRETVWGLLGLITVRAPEVLALPAGATVADLAIQLRGRRAGAVPGARIWGPSARFDGQRVGRAHRLADGDRLELLRR